MKMIRRILAYAFSHAPILVLEFDWLLIMVLT